MISRLKTRDTWRAIGSRVRGASHARRGLPNQDYIGWHLHARSRSGLPLVMAVSDGHGSALSFRSERGSRFAVEATIELSKGIFSNLKEFEKPATVKNVLLERLPRDLVLGWRERVQQDLHQSPFLHAEETRLLEHEGHSALAQIQENPFLAYGATLLTVLITPRFIAYLQLGDGDILTVSETGEVARSLPPDERLFANATTSLCLKDAWQDFRTSLHVLESPPPALIMLSTDGYANSFRNDASFFKAGSDLLDILYQEGIPAVVNNINHWLEETTQAGSGDDIALGILFRSSAQEGAAQKTRLTLFNEAPQTTTPPPEPASSQDSLTDSGQDDLWEAEDFHSPHGGSQEVD